MSSRITERRTRSSGDGCYVMDMKANGKMQRLKRRMLRESSKRREHVERLELMEMIEKACDPLYLDCHILLVTNN